LKNHVLCHNDIELVTGAYFQRGHDIQVSLQKLERSLPKLCSQRGMGKSYFSQRLFVYTF